MCAPRVVGSAAPFALGPVGFVLLMFAKCFLLYKWKSKDLMKGATRDSTA